MDNVNVKTRKLSTRFKKFILTGGLLSAVLFLSGCMRFDPESGAPQGFLSEVIYDFLIVPLDSFLGFLANFLGSYGLAIIVFSILFRLILLPLTLKQQRSTIESQVKMQGVQPVTQEIQAEIKETDDPSEQQALQMEMMEIYRENNISIGSQLTGCLPLLLQMPIFVAMLQVLRQSQDIAQSTFLGMDLGETSIVLALLTGLVYFLQSRLMISTMPGEQQQSAGITMYITPIMMIFIGISSPAGVSLYWFVSGVFSVFQQLFNTYYYKPKIEAEVEEKMGDVKTVKRKRKPKKSAPNASEESGNALNQSQNKKRNRNANGKNNRNRNRNAGKQQRNRRN
jgi:YidC/Oxa1 family membrane protein insertase